MRSRDTDDNISQQELRTLQRALRTRASNLKKNVRRYGLIRPLSQIDTDIGLVTFHPSVTFLRNGKPITQPLAYILDPEVCCFACMFWVAEHRLQTGTCSGTMFDNMQGYLFSVWNICAVSQVSRVQQGHMIKLPAVLAKDVLAADCVTGLLPAAFISIF